jgi:hypothetical protein
MVSRHPFWLWYLNGKGGPPIDFGDLAIDCDH